MARLWVVILTCVSTVSVTWGQLNFTPNYSISVSTGTITLSDAWAGGLNFCQFSEIDLNQDGVLDLLSFDRSGDLLKTFVYDSPSKKYNYAPQYQSLFPAIRNWVLTHDYNRDGKMDLFTYAQKGGGVDIYLNTSTPQSVSFKKVADLLLSDYAGSFLNLYISSADLPALADIDNDGDMDILTFEIAGTTLEWHRNMSREWYNHSDSLIFKRETRCWGSFAENSNSNSVSLNIQCPYANVRPSPQFARHSGSCELCIDADTDGDQDLLLGDVSYNNLVLLLNSDTSPQSYILSQDTSWPASSYPVDLNVFPCGFAINTDHTGISEIVVTPNAAYASSNRMNVWLYQKGNTANPSDYQLLAKDFLQNQMVDLGEGANPAFLDYNADGLLDMLVGNFKLVEPTGSFTSGLSLFKNVGTNQNPAFEWVTEDYLGLRSQNWLDLSPAVADIDGDGDMDLLLGEYTGKLILLTNKAGAGNLVDFDAPQTSFAGISVGNSSAPTLADINADGLLDLIVGERKGNVNLYLNKGSQSNPNFIFETDSLFKINVNLLGYYSGYSRPTVFQQGSNRYLAVGSDSRGVLFYYCPKDNFNQSLQPFYSVGTNPHVGIRLNPASADLDRDGYTDLIVGNYAGGISHYKGSLYTSIQEWDNEPFVQVYPNPATEVLTIQIPNKEHRGDKIRAELINAFGQVVSSDDLIQFPHHLYTGNLAAGWYILKISSASNTWNHYRKIIISK